MREALRCEPCQAAGDTEILLPQVNRDGLAILWCPGCRREMVIERIRLPRAGTGVSPDGVQAPRTAKHEPRPLGLVVADACLICGAVLWSELRRGLARSRVCDHHDDAEKARVSALAREWCQEPDCGRKAKSRGRCRDHYMSWWKALQPRTEAPTFHRDHYRTADD